MKSILAITSEPPWPLTSGGRIRTFHLLRQLAGTFPVRVITAVPEGDPTTIPALASSGIEIAGTRVRERSLAGEAGRLLGSTFRREPYVLYRRHDRAEVRSAITDEIRRRAPDLLYLDHLDSFVFRHLAPEVPYVIDLHNVYSALTHRTALEERSLKRWFLLRESRLLDRVEKRAVSGAAAAFAVSETERGHFSAYTSRQVHLIPNGVDCARFQHLPAGRRSGSPLILFVGTLSWPPNVSAAEHLAREVLPLVRRRLPDCRLRIVGRSPHERVSKLSDCPGVEVAGEVPDVVPHFAEAHVFAVPLDAGGGTRLKILESFAAGLPVVSTAVGCEGIDATDGEHLLVRERPRFAEGVLDLLGQPTFGVRIAENARLLCRSRYDWTGIGLRLVDAVGAIVGRS